MITASIAVLLILLIEHRVGSMALIVYPTIVGGILCTYGSINTPIVAEIPPTIVGYTINAILPTRCSIPLAMAVVASASYVGSGAAQFKNGTWVIAGIGDLITSSNHMYIWKYQHTYSC
jgi:uncharacterized membrane protein